MGIIEELLRQLQEVHMCGEVLEVEFGKHSLQKQIEISSGVDVLIGGCGSWRCAVSSGRVQAADWVCASQGFTGMASRTCWYGCMGRKMRAA